MMTLTRINFAALATLWTVSMACAQVAPNQPQEEAVPGAARNAAANPAALSKDASAISQTPWFNNSAIREELQLKDNQFNDLNQNYQQAWGRYHDGVSKLAPNLTDEQRQQQLTALTNQFRKDFSRGLEATIPTPSARERFHQLDWQYRGFAALHDPAVVDKLNLSDAQRRKFDQFGKDWDQQYANWSRSYSQNRDRVGRQLQEGRRQMWDDINATLTPEQREKWREMIGERFEFEPQVFFPSPVTSNSTLKPPLP